MNVHRVMRASLLFSFLLAASDLVAQSVTIFSSGQEARRCMSAAEIAANMSVATRDDLKDCDFAIENGKLSQKDLAATYCNRGVIKSALELYQEAFEDYGTAIEIMPELPEPYVGRGNVYFLANQLDRAIQDYDRAIDLNLGRLQVALLNRGMAYEAQGRLEQAENDYRRALELAPGWSRVQEKLDRVLAKRGR